MKVALIPPRGLYQLAMQSRVHLTLPHLCNDVEYMGTYLKAATRGDYIVLDNGEAEGQGIGGLRLRKMGMDFRAKEIVAPDTIGDADKTCDRIKNFFRNSTGATSSSVDEVVQYMAVVQGKSVKNLYRCADYFATFDKIKVIGIPRHLISTLEQPSIRIDFANWLLEMHGLRFQIHLLGTNPIWPQEVKFANKYAPNIRSVDTSMPFNYAIHGVMLQDNTRNCIPRPENYFSADHSTTNKSIFMHNINKLLEWAGE